MDVRSIRVETRRLDSLLLARSTVAIVKIDVEGHEMRTLEGMTGILEQSHPTLIVESEARHHPDSPQIVFNFLRNTGTRATSFTAIDLSHCQISLLGGSRMRPI